MKLFDSVVVACDNGPGMLRTACGIRAALETFGIRVHLYEMVQKRAVLDLLAGKVPDCQYVVLCCHGNYDEQQGLNITFQVVDQVDGDYSQVDGWEIVKFGLTPKNIPDFVNGSGRTLVSIACGSGGEEFAESFLKAGYKAYIGPEGGYVGTPAAVLFVIGFFYHLLTGTRDYEQITYTDREAVERAAACDADYTKGTRAFCYRD